MLASDLNNPEFANPRNPDELMSVEFYWHEPVDIKFMEETGKIKRLERRVYVRIQRPGDQTSIIETPAREDHKQRWPQKWLYFQMQEGLADHGKNIPGWSIDDWSELDADQRKLLKFLNFHVVEQIAGASDAQVQGIGMGGLGLRERARHALKARMDAGIRAEMEQKDQKISQLENKLDRLMQLVEQKIQPTEAPAETPDKPKRKYTKKVKNDDDASTRPTGM